MDRRDRCATPDRDARPETEQGHARALYRDRRYERRLAVVSSDRVAWAHISARASTCGARSSVRRALKLGLRVALALFAIVFIYLAVVFVQVWLAARRD